MDFTVGGRTYRAGKLDPFKQFHIVRRLAPLLTGLKGEDGDAGEEGGFLRTAAPAIEALARLPDQDVDYVLNTCLSVVTVNVGEGRGWTRLQAPGGKLMFEDIELADLFEIVRHVVEENLTGFFTSLQRLAPTPELPENSNL